MGESKRRKEKDPNYGKEINVKIQRFSNGFEYADLNDLQARYGIQAIRRILKKYPADWCHFIVWNHIIYVEQKTTMGVKFCPIIFSDRYPKFASIIDSAIKDLTGNPDGYYLFIPKPYFNYCGYFYYPTPTVMVSNIELVESTISELEIYSKYVQNLLA